MARERAAVILEVRSGKLTRDGGSGAVGGVAQDVLRVGGPGPESHGPGLGESGPREAFVPLDPEKEELQGKVQELEKKLYLAEKTIEVKDLLTAYDLHEAKKKQTKRGRRTGRSGKEGHGDHHGHQGKNRNALCPYLPGHKDPVIDLGPVAEEAKGNHPLLNRPGPKKVEPFDPSVLDAEIRSLDHGPKRSGGANNLYKQYQENLSRRDLSKMVEQVRREMAADHRNHLRRIEWLAPGVVWAMDVTEDEAGKRNLHLQNTQDLGSRYKFPPLSGECPVGEEVAGYLSEKFSRFGPPLFLKRDNGGT